MEKVVGGRKAENELWLEGSRNPSGMKLMIRWRCCANLWKFKKTKVFAAFMEVMSFLIEIS